MLEVKWKVTCMAYLIRENISFNPCYVGSKMESETWLFQILVHLRFNPCYVGSKMESFW